MTNDEFEEHLQLIGWSIRQTAERFGCPEQTIRRMVSGERDIPREVARYVRRVASVIGELRPPDLSRQTKSLERRESV